MSTPARRETPAPSLPRLWQHCARSLARGRIPLCRAFGVHGVRVDRVLGGDHRVRRQIRGRRRISIAALKGCARARARERSRNPPPGWLDWAQRLGACRTLSIQRCAIPNSALLAEAAGSSAADGPRVCTVLERSSPAMAWLRRVYRDQPGCGGRICTIAGERPILAHVAAKVAT